MSPGINDGPRNTGTLPKSNRRNDRNRERSAANQQNSNRTPYHGLAQLSNNLLQLDWQPVNDREPSRSTKNSNTRSVFSVPSTSYQDISELVSHNSGRYYNYSEEPWQKMVPPTDLQTQSPPRLQGAKPTNVDRMPPRSEVEGRLNQIRDYIRVTSTMMDSLNQSSDPRAQAQNEKLGGMIEDLYDSERKLAKLLAQYQSEAPDENGDSGKEDGDENGEGSRELDLRRKMEESQRKLAELQEHQANLVGMQLQVRERLNKARQAQQALLQQVNENPASCSTWESNNQVSETVPSKEQLESETAVIRGKLAQLQSKKKRMDHLVAELQAVELSDRASCSSEGSRNRDKAAELEAMKAQLAHLKALMEDATRVRECLDSTSEPEPDVDVNGDTTDDMEPCEGENSSNISSNLFERQNYTDEPDHGKPINSGDRPTVEDIQAVTRELREQQLLLQATRAELQRLKQPLMGSTSGTAYSSSTPPPQLVAALGTEKKQSNTVTGEGDKQTAQVKKRQMEDLVRKQEMTSCSTNRDMGGPDQSSQRGSNSHISHTSTPANIWPAPTVTGGSNEHSVDGISSSENLLDIGPQTNAIENGFHGNWVPYAPPPVNQLQHGSAEYYRQLLLGSQSQQLQMMGTTIQQCCHLLWAQQRELQSMRTAITQLQQQLRQTQGFQRVNNTENHEEYSNLSRNMHHLDDALDAALPPSSSLPNLVSLPNSTPALSHTPIVASAHPQQQHQHQHQQHQHQQQQQLNNQVPPGNRANNYWDNFRSYSRQNLLSGNIKTVADTSGPVVNTASSTNAAAGGMHSSIIKDKRNREQSVDNLPVPSLGAFDAQYSLNLQLPSNLQQQGRENTAARSNIISNEVSQSQDNLWEEAHSSYRLPSTSNGDNPLNHLSPEMREALCSLVVANKRRPDYLVIILREIKAISEDHRLRPQLLRSLRALQDTQSLNNPLNETTYQTASESCQSSDEDSEAGAIMGYNAENQSLTELVTSTQAGISSPSIAHVPSIDYVDIPGQFMVDAASALPTSAVKPGYNEDLAEADQSRPESSGNQQVPVNDIDNADGEEAAAHSVSGQAAFDVEGHAESLGTKAEDERSEDAVLDRIPTRLYHH